MASRTVYVANAQAEAAYRALRPGDEVEFILTPELFISYMENSTAVQYYLRTHDQSDLVRPLEEDNASPDTRTGERPDTPATQ